MVCLCYKEMQETVKGADTMPNIYHKIEQEVTSNKAVVLTTSLLKERFGQTSDLDKKIVYEEELINQENELFLQVLKEGKPKLIQMEKRNHESLLLAEPFYPKERLIILGGGHIALPLVEIAARVGFLVTIADDRPSFANTKRFPNAEKVICESFDTCLDQIKLTRNDYIVIITRGHKHDTKCLRQILMKPETIYVGMIGSRRRVGVVKQELQEEGFDKERLERVCTPIGLSIGAATPEEISIAIIAQLIQRKRLDKVKDCMVNRSDLDSYMLSKLAGVEQESCCMVTIIDTKGSVPRGVGSKMLVFKTGEIIGSIGGGCSESAIMRTALSLIGSRTWTIQDIDMTGDAALEEGMVCGGIMTVLLEDIRF